MRSMLIHMIPVTSNKRLVLTIEDAISTVSKRILTGSDKMENQVSLLSFTHVHEMHQWFTYREGFEDGDALGVSDGDSDGLSDGWAEGDSEG